MSIDVAQERKVLRDGASIWPDIEGLLQYRGLCGHILDWQTNFADMKHISRSKGSRCLVVQVVVRNTFQDIVGCITKVERARIEIGKEDFILAVLAQQGHALTQPTFSLGIFIPWNSKGDMVKHVLLRFLIAQACRANLDNE